VTEQNRYEIQVRAESRYLPEQSNPQQSVYAFAYTIRITNRSTMAAQLISRHWLIEDSDGQVREVKGLGVVGHQPLLNPGESFEYSSGSQIETPTGRMRGSYFFVADDGTRFDAPIPEFTLSMPRTLH
jgi:ApaG protein